MQVQVITDSTSDITQEMAGELGIRVVPIYIRFGDKVYRDGVDMKTGEFYASLAASAYHPATSQPTPEDFTAVYREYCEKADGILSVHISSRISGTYNSAVMARKILGSKCPIEIIDSGFNSGGLALTAMAAARLAKEKESLAEMAEEVRKTLKKVDMFGVFDTMKYLARSGRVSKAIVMAADFLNVKPLLTFREGEIIRAGLVRSLAKGADRICRFVESKKNVAEMIIVHSEIPEKAEELKVRLGNLFPREQIRTMGLGAGLGVHGGPGVLLVALRES